MIGQIRAHRATQHDAIFFSTEHHDVVNHYTYIQRRDREVVKKKNKILY